MWIGYIVTYECEKKDQLFVMGKNRTRWNVFNDKK